MSQKNRGWGLQPPNFGSGTWGVEAIHTVYIVTVATINIYYCMTGRAIWGNIQFEAGSIGPSAARDNTEAEN